MLPKYGYPRLKFSKGEQRKFVESIFQKSGLKAENLAKIVSVSPRTIRDWKREKFHITKSAMGNFCNIFQIKQPKGIEKMIEEWKIEKLGISRKGGLVYYKKYGLPGTTESRRRGGVAGLAKLRALGLVAPVKTFKHPKYSIGLAEFVGIMLGDGNIGNIQISVSLNSIKDADYSLFVSNLCKKLFGHTPKIRRKKGCNCLDIYCYGTNLVTYLVKVGMKVGNKVKLQVRVPSWINKKVEYKIACLRGLMDTDGGVFVHKYRVGGKVYQYRKICFTNRSVPLLRFVYNTLNELGFTAKIIDKVENKKVWLYNTHEVDRYLKIVKSSNQRLNSNLL